jgi:hypothetical protein
MCRVPFCGGRDRGRAELDGRVEPFALGLKPDRMGGNYGTSKLVP